MPNQTPVNPTTDAFAEAQKAVFRNAGGPGGVQDNIPLATGPSLEQEAAAKVKRQEASTFGDKVQSMWRQDGIVDGILAHHAGSQMLPQEGYNPFEEKEWKELSEGISDELLPALYEARSPAHARYVKDLLMQKQEDQQRLADLGAWGTAGRLAFGAVMPDQILAGMVGGRVAQAVKFGRVVAAGRAAKGATTGGEALAAEARAAAESAKIIARDAKGAPLASGAAAGAVANAGFEVIRQQYNFEDDSTSVLLAGLMGAGLSVPFSLLHIRGQRRIAGTAAKEAEALEALRASHSGEQITPRQAQVLDEVVTMNSLVRDIESGRLNAVDAETRLNEFRKRMEQDAESFARDHAARLRRETDAIIAERFPGAMGPHKPTATITPAEKHKLMQAANREDAEWKRKRADEAKAAKVKVDEDLTDPKAFAALAQRATGKAEPTALELAFVKADTKLKAKRAAAKAEREAAGKDLDIEAAWTVRDAQDSAGATRAREEAFDAAEQQHQRETEAAYNEREMQLAERPPVVAPEAAPVVAPSLEGADVHWAGRDGETMYGKVSSVREDGRLVVKDLEDKTHVIRRGDLDWDSPGFETAPAPAGFIARGSIGSGQREAIESVAEQETAMRNLRMDIFATLNRSENPLVKRMAFDLVKDPIQVDSMYAQGWTATEWKSHYKRTIAGRFYWESKQALREAIKARKMSLVQRLRSGFDREFHELVTRVTRGDERVLADNADIAPQLRRASKAMRDAYDEMYAEAVAAGVKGTDEIAPKDFYVNRQWDVRKIREVEARHGSDAVVRLLAEAIRVPGHVGDLKKAARFIKAVKRLEFSPVMQDIMLHARDMGTLRRELRDTAKLSDDDIDTLVDAMFEAKATSGEADAGRAANLKFRFDIDENHVVATEAGELRIADLLENDSRMLIDLYFNSMAGHTALAKKGITSQADWDTRMREVSDWFTENQAKVDSAKRDLSILEDIHKNVTGRPMSTQDFSATNRIAGAFRGYTRSVMLGQLGFAAAFEMKQAAALFGVRAMFAHMPTLVGILKGMRSGHVPGMQLARDISHISGFANELAMSYARHAEVEDGFAGRTLHNFETASNTASHVVDRLSGNAGITAMTRNWAGRMATQKFVDFAARPATLTPKWRERMVGWGVNDDDLDLMLEKLVAHTERGPGGRVESIKYEDWLRDSPETYETFQLALSRAARDAIQDQDLGETAMFMHSTLGKVFGELRSFFLVAHAKNMLKNLHYRDATALQVWMLGLLGESLAYMTQTTANFAHDPDELAERLTPERIAGAAFFRMASAGMLPALIDTMYSVGTGGDSLVQQGSTVATDNRSLLQTPSLVMAGRLTKAPQTLTGILLGTDVATQAEMRSLMGVIPGSRLLGVSNAINALVDMQPKYDPEKGR